MAADEARAATSPAPGRAAEIELKLRLRAQDLAPLRARLDRMAPSRAGRVDNIYYDTPDRRLAAARAALRLRSLAHEGRRRWVQTFKTEDAAHALSARGEWETPARAGRLDLARLAHAPLAAALGGGAAGRAALARLAPVFRTVFTRQTWHLHAFGARIEAVIDEGWVGAGRRREPILELELELHSGARTALAQLALALCGEAAAGLSLLPYGDSKAARGYRLAQGGAPPGPVPGLAPLPPGQRRFAPGDTPARAARRWMALELGALLANAQGACTSASSEFVHQARVALRVMRVGVEWFAGEEAVPENLARDLRTWARRFAAVRQWDVLCEHLLPRLHTELARELDAAAPSWTRMRARAAAQQQAARALLQEQLDGPDFARFALRVLLWSEADPVPGQGGGRTLAQFARRSLRKGRRRLAEAMAQFPRAGPKRQHRIRLQAKSLRYAAQMLRELAPQQLGVRQLRALGRFQDLAGDLRDAQLARASLAGLTRSRVLLAAIDAWVADQERRGRPRVKRLARRFAPRFSPD